MKHASVVCFFTGLIVAGAAAAEEALLTLYYSERPPYQFSVAGGDVKGVTAERATVLLRAAGVPFRWAQLSAKREVQRIRDNQEAACLVGWFRRPEREVYALFSLPIYRDGPPMLVARADYEHLSFKRFDELLTQKSPSLLVKDSYSYGEYLDQLLMAHAGLRVVTSEEQPAMLLQIQRSRADLMFLASEEASYHSDAPQKMGLVTLSFDDLQQGETRHLMCSRKIPIQWLERINAQIRADNLPQKKP